MRLFGHIQPLVVLWVMFFPGTLPGQVRPGPVVTAGYEAPQPIKVAPGQVITLFVHSDGTQPPRAEQATAVPLPLALNDYSVVLEQTVSPEPRAVPLFAVYPVDNCFGLSPSACEPLTAITVQIPWELSPNVPGSRRPTNFAILRVAFRGTPGDAFPLDPVPDRIHLVNTCDATRPPGANIPDVSGPCKPVVTHMDGELVTSANPARGGESLVVYALGLGTTADQIRSGDAARAPVPIPDVGLLFEFGPNVAARAPSARGERPGNAPIPIFSGLTPGQVGLYQITISVPVTPGDLPSCTASSIASNLTVSIGRTVSFDGAGICVAPKED